MSSLTQVLDFEAEEQFHRFRIFLPFSVRQSDSWQERSKSLYVFSCQLICKRTE